MKTAIKPIKQGDSIACGPTCILIASNSLKHSISYKEIQRISNYKKRDGLSNRELAGTCKKLGFGCNEYKNSSWEELAINFKKSDQVIIVSWMKEGYIGHFSVVENMSKTHIFLADPMEGKIIKLRKIHFLRLWMDYDEMWYPKKNTDIQLRWFLVLCK